MLGEGQVFLRRDTMSKTPIFLQVHTAPGGPVLLSFRTLECKEEALSQANCAPFGAVAAIRPGRDKLSIVLTSSKGKDMIVNATPGKGSGNPLNAVQVRDTWLRHLVQARNELQLRLQARTSPGEGSKSSQRVNDDSDRIKPRERATKKGNLLQAESTGTGQPVAPLEFRPNPAYKAEEAQVPQQSVPPKKFNPFATSEVQPAHREEGIPSAFLGVVQSSNSSIPGSEKYTANGFPL